MPGWVKTEKLYVIAEPPVENEEIFIMRANSDLSTIAEVMMFMAR